MKKIFTFFLVAFVSLFSMPAKAADYPDGDLKTIINGATEGEVINLTGTTYSYSDSATLDKSLTIQANPLLTQRPVITCGFNSVFFTAQASTNQTLTLRGLEFNGNAKALGLIKSSATATLTIIVDNCKTLNFSIAALKMFTYTAVTSTPATTINGDLTVSNSEFVGSYPKSIIITTTTILSPNNISFTNCYFNGLNTNNNTIYITSLTKLASIKIDHCTFRDCTTGAKAVFYFPNISGWTPALLTNNIFVDIQGSSSNVTQTNANNAKNVVYNSGDAALAKWYKLASSSTGATTTAANPILTLDPALDLTTGVTTQASYLNAGTDGKTIGYYGVSDLNTDFSTVSSAANTFTVAQLGANFTVNGIADAAYTVYSVSGSQVATGVIKAGNFQMNANKGIYMLKVNGQVAKFSVR
jgi:hypothetical protein